jgi:hypothetical protein
VAAAIPGVPINTIGHGAGITDSLVVYLSLGVRSRKKKTERLDQHSRAFSLRFLAAAEHLFAPTGVKISLQAADPVDKKFAIEMIDLVL